MLTREPTTTAVRADVDVRDVEPGRVVWDRYVVAEQPRAVGEAWHVLAVDADRQLGDAPHHRLRLEFLPAASSQRHVLLRALDQTGAESTRRWDVFETRSGVAVASAAPDAELAPPEQNPLEVAVTLARLLARYHAQGLAGIRFRIEDLGLKAGRVRVLGFGHLQSVVLADTTTRSFDLRVLLRVLGEVLPDGMASLLEPAPASAQELCERIEAYERPLDERPFLPDDAPFVGRESELELLQGALARVRRRRALGVHVDGVGGSGKTRLVDRFIRQLRARDDAIVVLEGRCPSGAASAGSPLAQALESLADPVRAGGTVAQRRIGRRITRALGNLTSVLLDFVPGLQPLLGPQGASPSVELDETFVRHVKVVADVLRCVGTATAPLVLVIDDAEALDPGTGAVLADLLHDPDHHTMIVVAGRPSATKLLDPAVRVRLGPLSIRDVDALLTRTLGRASRTLVTALHELSQGSPWAVWSILQKWIDGGRLVRQEDHWDLGGNEDPHERSALVSPESLHRHRLQSVSQDARRLLLLAALSGDRATWSWLQELEASARARDALQELVDAGLLVSEDAWLRFPHALLRESIIEASHEVEVRTAHAAIADWLWSRPDGVSPAQLAWHQARSGRGTSQVLGELHLAGGRELLSVYDLDRARWHFERALDACRDPDERARALEGLADCAVLSGRPEDATRDYLAAVDLHPDPVEAVWIGSKGTHALYVKSSSDLAIEVGRRALERAGHPAPGSTREALLVLPLDLARAFIGRSREDPRLRDALCRLYPYLTAASLISAQVFAISYVLRGKRMARGLTTENAAFSMAFYGGVQGNLGRFAAAQAELAAAEHLADGAKDPWVLGVIHHIRGHAVLLPGGRYEDGQHSLDAAVQCFRQSGNLAIAALSLFFKAVYGRHREEPATLLAWLDEAVLMARRHGTELALPDLQALRLLVAASTGVDVARDVEALARSLDRGKIVPTDRLATHIYLALAWLQLDNLHQAREQLELGRTLYSELPGAPEMCEEIHFATGEVLLARPQLDRAERRWLRRSIQALRRAGKASPRLRAAGLFIELRWALHQSRTRRAQRLLDALVGDEVAHGQTELVKKARALVAGRTLPPPSAEVATAADERPSPLRPGGDEASQSREPEADAREALVQLRRRAQAMMPTGAFLFLEAEAGLRIPTRGATLQTLLFQLLCTVRDAVATPSRLALTIKRVELTEAETSRLAGSSPGAYAELRVEAGPGPVAPIMGGLLGCRRLLEGLRGFLHTTESTDGSALTAYVPLGAQTAATPDPLAAALVVHDDERIRETVARALSASGYRCQVECTLPEGSLTTFALVMVDRNMVETVKAQSGTAPVIGLVPRSGSAPAPSRCLRVPFSIQELEGILSDGAEGSSGAVLRPG